MRYGSGKYILEAISVMMFLAVGYFYFREPTFGLALPIVVIVLLIPSSGIWFLKKWEAFGHLLSRILNTVLLSAIFFLVLTPLALLRKIYSFGSRKKRESWYQTNLHIWNEKDLDKPW